MKLQLVFLASFVTGSFGGIPVVIEKCLLDENKCFGTDRSTMCVDYANHGICQYGTCNQIEVYPYFFCSCPDPYTLSADEHYCFEDDTPVAAPVTSAPVAAPTDASVVTEVEDTECATDNNCDITTTDCTMVNGAAKCLCEDGSYVNEYEACQQLSPCSGNFCFGDENAVCKLNLESSRPRPECWCPGLWNGTHYEDDYKIAFYASCGE